MKINFFGIEILPAHKDKIIKCPECGVFEAKGKNLEFISCIKRDGSGTVPVDSVSKDLDRTNFKLTCLSITNGTFIASEFNSYVVKIKK